MAIVRMRQIRERLAGVDLDDPDRRLELQLALKIRRLGTTGAEQAERPGEEPRR